MNCSIIRDLMPIYDGDMCSKAAKQVVEEHLRECDDCRCLYDDIHEILGLKACIKTETAGNSTSQMSSKFLERYYGRLMLKGIGLFLVIYIVALIARIAFKGLI